MSKKGLDISFVHYGIRKDDMQIIESLCTEHGLDFEWLQEELLKAFHSSKINDNELSEKSIKKIIEKALNKIKD